MKKEFEIEKYAEIIENYHLNERQSFDWNEFKKKLNKIEGGKYSLWILEQFKRKNIKRLEDFERIKEALKLFQKNLKKFSDHQKQLHKMNFEDLENLIEDYKKISEKGKDEIDILHEDDKYKIIVPLTKQASIYWGKNTKWCTATNENNKFDEYNKDGRLFIILTNEYSGKKQIKYQIHCSGQLMDINDNEVKVQDIPLIEKIFELCTFEEKLKFFFSEQKFWKYFPEFITKDMIIGYINQSFLDLKNYEDLNINDIPEEFKDEEFYTVIGKFIMDHNCIPNRLLYSKIKNDIEKYIPDFIQKTLHLDKNNEIHENFGFVEDLIKKDIETKTNSEKEIVELLNRTENQFSNFVILFKIAGIDSQDYEEEFYNKKGFDVAWYDGDEKIGIDLSGIDEKTYFEQRKSYFNDEKLWAFEKIYSKETIKKLALHFNDIFEKHHNLLNHEEIADILLNKCTENSALAQYENLIVNSPSVYNYFMNRGVDLIDYIDFKPEMSIHPNFFKKINFDNFTDDELEEMQFKVLDIMIKYKMCYDYISNIVYLSDRIIDKIEKEIPKMFHKSIFSSFE